MCTVKLPSGGNTIAVYKHININPSGRTEALGSTQPLTEMSTRNMRNALFCVIRQRVMVILYRIFRNNQSDPSSTTTRCITTQKNAVLICFAAEAWNHAYHEYVLWGKGGRCIWLTILLLSWADCLEIWEPQISEALRAYLGMLRDCFSLTDNYQTQLKKTYKYIVTDFKL
jgi:hypothetical protein